MIGKNYIPKGRCKTFEQKPPKIQRLINETLYILSHFGVPIEGSHRRIERMAMAFLACSDVKSSKDFSRAKDSNDKYGLSTRDIIKFNNQYFSERISSGSYDDIRRKDLQLIVLADIIVRTNPQSARNDSTRGYVLNPVYAKLLRQYGSKDWEYTVAKELKHIESIENKLKRKRELDRIPVTINGSIKIKFSTGEHNVLQKAIIEDFLPLYGFKATILYVGDTSDKYLYVDRDKLAELNFFEISHEELPDILAYSEQKNWLYVIEAVHSSGPISETRLLKLSSLVNDCTCDIVYVTAFLDRKTFRKWTAEIAWETEVWIAESPEHLIHFNGDKFLGPYKP